MASLGDQASFASTISSASAPTTSTIARMRARSQARSGWPIFSLKALKPRALAAAKNAQAAGIGAHPVVCAAKQAIERQPKLLGLQIPNRLVDRLPKQAGTNIPAARARQTVRQHKRALAYQ